MKKIIGCYRKCDLITMFGTLCSFVGITLVLSSHYTLATLCMVLSGICDMFDGKVARKHKYTKEQQTYGVELDSLSDSICFGLFPAIITVAISPFLISKIICCFYMLCGIIRLANFNTLDITSETKQQKFVGVPITTVAILYPIVFILIRLINFSYLAIVMPILLLILGIAFIIKIEIPKPDVLKILKKILKKIFNKYIINYVIFPIFLIIASDFVYRLNFNSISDSFKAIIDNVAINFMPFLLMIIVIDIIFLMFNAIFKKSSNTVIAILILLVTFLTINDIKFNIMGVPLEIADVGYLNPDNMAMMGTATGTIGKWIKWVIIKELFIVGLGLIFVIINKKNNISIDKRKHRIIYTILGLILLVIFAVLSSIANDFIIKNIYRKDYEEVPSYTTVEQVYSEFGFWQGMYINHIYDNAMAIPKGYSKSKTNELLKEYENNTANNKWDKANVVFILAESYSNLDNIDEIEFDRDLTENISSYKNDNDKAVLDLLVPSYGGVSVNTEFEILTSASLAFWRPGFIPYTKYYNETNGALAPNIIKEFNNNGYETMYLTPWGKDSYKSQFVYNLFNTDRTIYGNELKGQKKGKYYSDKDLMKDIYNELKETSEGNYKFIMAATAQNHFPYNGDVYEKYDIEVVKSSFNEEDTKILKNYAQGLYDADKELNNLYEMIQELDVPTIIVFYGDHLPYTVDSEGEDPYTNSSYFNTESKELNNLRKYTTQAVMLSNYDVEFENLEYIKSSYLGAYILNQLDLEISNYFKFIDDARKVIPVFNSSTIYKDGQIYKHNNANKEVINMLKNYRCVQYGSFYDFAE